MDKLLLVDGSNLLFQMFYGMPNAIPDPAGRDIRGTVGFLGALRKILLRVRPTHAAVLFDGECANPRNGIDAAYKANRPDFGLMPEEDTPFSQLPHIYAALDRLGICHKETESCETDDWIAGYALSQRNHMQVVICSFDSDYFQLITQNVSVLRYRGDRSAIWTPETVMEKLGIAPEQYAAFKSLTGDSSDNIPGVPKVGPKTAAALLEQFGTLDALLAAPEKIQRLPVRAAIAEAAERIRKNYSLIRLENRMPLPFPVQALRVSQISFSTTLLLADMGLR